MTLRKDDRDARSRSVSELLGIARMLSERYLAGLSSRPVYPSIDLEALERSLGGRLPDASSDPVEVLRSLGKAIEPALVASSGPRYFGFVTGGSLPVTVAVDWLTSAWDQNGALLVMGPGVSVAERAAGRWTLEILGLPATASVGFVTGCQMANFTCLAAARNHVLSEAGWDVEDRGLAGAPPVHVVLGAEAHVTVPRALRMLGLGAGTARVVETDAQGRMIPEALGRALEDVRGPTIVCAQAGNVNTGAFDPLSEVVAAAREHGAWLHVDGAFGLWANASAARRALLKDVEKADSWATDAHKWLNVPYDNGIAIVAHPAPHERAMSVRASYLERAADARVDPLDRVPESSRRARGLTVYAALKTLGRLGVAELVERCCELAERLAELLRRDERLEVLNEVVLNQVLVRVRTRETRQGIDADALTRALIERVQGSGVCWMGGTTWHGMAAMRISVANWSTGAEDIDRSVEAVRGALDFVLAPS